MKHKNFVLIIALIIISSIIASCTRSASDGPSDAAAEDSELPNPVSTQSQLMKDIISGTQTAMAAPLDATAEAPAEDDEGETVGEGTAETTPEPEGEEEEIILPTSTAGPPPIVELNYNTKECPPNIYICEISNVKDQTITIQSSHPYLYKGEDLTFKLAPDGEYDLSKYILAGIAKYEPDSSKGTNFQVTLNVPDSLRGVSVIVVRLDTIDPGRWGRLFYDNN